MQILDKVTLLTEDPAPHGSLKKKPHGYKGNIYRVRSGGYRIIYTYGDGWSKLLDVDDRNDVHRGEQLAVSALPDVRALLEPEAAPGPPFRGGRSYCC